MLVELVFLQSGLAQNFQACFVFFSLALTLCNPVSFLLFLLRGSDQFFRAYLKISPFVLTPCNPVRFIFLFCLSLSYLSALDYFCEGSSIGRLFSSYLTNAYLCGIRRIHTELNYEAIPGSSMTHHLFVQVTWYFKYESFVCTGNTCISSTSHLFVQGTPSGQTISSYGWCNVIPHVVFVFS